jgi:hypothetical protein
MVGNRAVQEVDTLPEEAPLDSLLMMNMLKADEFPTSSWDNFLDADIRDFFNELFFKTGLQPATVIRDAHISRTFGYQLINGTRIGSRDYYLSLAYAMRLDLRDVQRLLGVTQAGCLHPLVKRDAALIFAFNHGYNTAEVYEFLTGLSLEPLNTGMA